MLALIACVPSLLLLNKSLTLLVISKWTTKLTGWHLKTDKLENSLETFGCNGNPSSDLELVYKLCAVANWAIHPVAGGDPYIVI